MLSGKKFTKCMRAFRRIVEMILESFMNDVSIQTYDIFMTTLNVKAHQSRTCTLWQMSSHLDNEGILAE